MYTDLSRQSDALWHSALTWCLFLVVMACVRLVINPSGRAPRHFRRITLTILGLIGLTAVLSCHRVAPGEAVPIEGSPDAASEIAGTWTGRYWSQDTGRHGSITFSMGENADSGRGEVEITFSPAVRSAAVAAAVDPRQGESDPALNPEPCPFLSIKVVRLERHRVRGTLVPYWDPDCDCRAETVFEGKISGNRITGTFTTRRASSDRRVLTGAWRAERAR